MNAPANGLPQAPLDRPVAAPAAVAAPRPLYWSVRRELWEHRSTYLAPFAVAALVLLGFLISMFTLPESMQAALSLGPAKQAAELARPYRLAASVIILTSFIVGALYCLEALHGERRDRSILFWKSLPVSDLTTVVSKAAIPLAILPLLVCAIVLAVQLIMLLVNTAVLLGHGQSAVPLWTQPHWFQMTVVMLYGVAAHVLWYAPMYGWLLLVSAWVRRSPLLWALLPPLAIIAVEKIAFDTSHFAALLKYRFLGAMMEAFTGRTDGEVHRLDQLDPGRFLSSPGLWLGLVFAAVFIAAAIRLRRLRDPI
ncbi:MAG: hypothetical protein ACXWGU_18840 [Usitatibacter sp.]